MPQACPCPRNLNHKGTCMSLPKAVILRLGGYDARLEEIQLRKVGFATGSIAWEELRPETSYWLQLGSVLADGGVCAWVIAGESKDFTPEIYASISLLSLSLSSASLPATAIVQCDNMALPPAPLMLEHCAAFHSLDSFAAKLMVARLRKNKPSFVSSCPLRSHLDPLTGLWLEIFPQQTGFTIGVLEAEIIAFGVGKRGVIPASTTLTYPILGISGDINGTPFHACAAQNTIGNGCSCFCKIQGLPSGVFWGLYPEENAFSEMEVVRFA